MTYLGVCRGEGRSEFTPQSPLISRELFSYIVITHAVVGLILVICYRIFLFLYSASCIAEREYKKLEIIALYFQRLDICIRILFIFFPKIIFALFPTGHFL